MKKYLFKIITMLTLASVLLSSCSMEYRERHRRHDRGHDNGHDHDHDHDHSHYYHQYRNY